MVPNPKISKVSGNESAYIKDPSKGDITSGFLNEPDSASPTP